MRTFGKAFHYLSLDIVAGACICSVYIAHLVGSSVSPYAVVTLGLAVWLIYTFDHLTDAQKLRVEGKPRHQFHAKNAKVIRMFFMLVGITAGVLLFFIPSEVLTFGVMLLVLVGFYFLLIRLGNRKLGLFKELLVATIYSAGLFAPSISWDSLLKPSTLILFSTFLLLAWINLLLFSWFDKDYDQRAGFHSMATVVGKTGSRMIIGILLVAYFSLIILNELLGLSPLPREVIWILLIMGVILATIVIRPQYFTIQDRYRLIADSIFLIPLAALLT